MWLATPTRASKSYVIFVNIIMFLSVFEVSVFAIQCSLWIYHLSYLLVAFEYGNVLAAQFAWDMCALLGHLNYPPQPRPWTRRPSCHIVFWTHRLWPQWWGVPEESGMFLWIITAVLCSVSRVKADYLHERGRDRTLFLKTVLWGEVVGCIVLGSYPSCQITIQLTVFPEVAVMSSDAFGGVHGSRSTHCLLTAQ